MEQENSAALIQRQASKLSKITQLNTGDYKTVLNALQPTIEKTVADSIPLKELINLGAKEPHMVTTIALLIRKYAEFLSVGGNLKPGQEVEISKMLLEEYPTASLDDFDLMLKRGVMGRYSEKTLGFDSVSIGNTTTSPGTSGDKNFSAPFNLSSSSSSMSPSKGRFLVGFWYIVW